MQNFLKAGGNAPILTGNLVPGAKSSSSALSPTISGCSIWITVVLVLLHAIASAGAQSTFSVSSFGFSAYSINGVNNATLTLIRGATYTFNVNASGHPFWIKTSATTGTGNAYSQGVANNGLSVGTLTFVVPANAPSTLFYICQFHSAMQGRLNIIDPPSPPVVTLTNPPSGITMAAPATITLRASAADSDGTITNVQFFSGPSVLGNAATSPYALVVTNLSAGTYQFTAQAIDNSGLRATSAVVAVTVVMPEPIRFHTGLVPQNGQMPLRLSVTPGLTYQIAHSTTFTNWVLLTNFVATNSVMNFTSPMTGSEPRFFRATQMPNP